MTVPAPLYATRLPRGTCDKGTFGVLSAHMAITKSAKKAIRSSDRKRVFNLRRKSALHDATKAVQKALAAKDVAGAEKLLPAAYQAIDKASKRGVIKTNTAARKKARLAMSIRRAVS